MESEPLHTSQSRRHPNNKTNGLEKPLAVRAPGVKGMVGCSAGRCGVSVLFIQTVIQRGWQMQTGASDGGCAQILFPPPFLLPEQQTLQSHSAHYPALLTAPCAAAAATGTNRDSASASAPRTANAAGLANSCPAAATVPNYSLKRPSIIFPLAASALGSSLHGPGYSRNADQECNAFQKGKQKDSFQGILTIPKTMSFGPPTLQRIYPSKQMQDCSPMGTIYHSSCYVTLDYYCGISII
ncbi:uncharacterized protein LOC121402801 [Xenopus laevis]|uniref:Uncharacterized protein LOC121402801 n=1 Tax=Xenopus laevis TaxID=8355 RepID=A0A8J1MU01_XENLA|nr:uncharacterized protein LOC121402801 [Xenopus laevis]